MKIILPKLIAHRGAPLSAPENTLTSLRTAKSLGAQWVECDVQLTRDKRAIIFHDNTLERTTNGTGWVANTDFAAIGKLDAGSWFSQKFKGETIPSVEAYVQCAAELALGINIELKGTPAQADLLAQHVLTALHTHWPHDLPAPLISSASTACLQALTAQYPQGYILSRWTHNWDDITDKLGCISLHIEHQQLNPARVEAVKRAGKKLLAYTVNDAAIATALFDMGVDAIFTDNLKLFE